MFKVTARDQGHYKGPSGAFVTYCNISCFFLRKVLDCKLANVLAHKLPSYTKKHGIFEVEILIILWKWW